MVHMKLHEEKELRAETWSVVDGRSAAVHDKSFISRLD
jgi:hypothetical protein